MKSMTGYGASEGLRAESEISVVLKSVNGRFLETRFHLPRELFFAENVFKKELQKLVRRGTVDIYIHRRQNQKAVVDFNAPLAKTWKRTLQALAQATGLKVSDDKLFERLAANTQIFEPARLKRIGPAEMASIQSVFGAALKSLDKERVREGKALMRSVLQLLAQIKKHVHDIEGFRQVSNKEAQKRLNHRLEKLGLNTTMEPSRLAQEVIIFLDRADISEEITRLREHVDMLQKEVESPLAQGKKLDFYCQELLREVNTIGSKANMAKITQCVVEAKGLIEALKEQIQNVE